MESSGKREIIQMTMKEHIKNKSMWAGSKTFQKEEIFIKQDNKFVMSQVSYPPVLYKIIDEIITNAIDHYVVFPKEVTEIKIAVNKTGMISVYNNGPGISVIKKKNRDGVEMYQPQMIYCEYFAGSNLNHDPNRIVGGTNGLGAKLTTVFSKLMVIETLSNGTHYKQSVHDGLDKIDDPIITYNVKEKDYTNISFIPNYSEFENKSNENIDWYKIIYLICENRAWQAAAYVNANVYFNNKLIKLPKCKFTNYCLMFIDDVISFQMTSPKSKHVFDICLGLSNGSFGQISLINGVYLPNGGPHIKYIQNLINDNLKSRLTKILKKVKVVFKNSMINNNLFLFVKGSIPNIDFVGQTKETYNTSSEKFDGYEIQNSDMDKIWQLLEPIIMQSLLQKQLGDLKIRTNRSRLDIPKYKGANNCGNPKLSSKCCLIITEGDSATGTVNIGLMGNIPNFNYDYYGTYGVEGVIVNALKESLISKVSDNSDSSEESNETKKTKKKKPIKKSADMDDDTNTNNSNNTINNNSNNYNNSINATNTTNTTNITNDTTNDTIISNQSYESLQLVPNNKLLDNVRLSNLIKILGLDFRKKYELNEKGNKEFKTLRYGSIAGLTDADLDGFNIFGLICTFFMSYWPSLVKRGFIKKIKTPIVRAYPYNKKKYVEEFYSEKELKLWISQQGENVKSQYSFNYYKGLGSHVEAMGEVKSMFENIEKKLITYSFDELALQSMYVSYGSDTSPRKKYLSHDVDIEEIIGNEIPISQQFLRDTKLYQRDNLTRKLPNFIDGFVISRRKVFYTARKVAKSKIKVAGLSSSVVTEANYHHGEDSLSKTIIRMAQGFPGARNLPLLIPLGNFGSRYTGYKDFAAPRYIHTKYNTHMADKLFRPEDDYILEYELDEGKRYEPKFYVPILPYVLLETNEIPATGWSVNIHARKLSDVISNTKKMIKGEIKECAKLPYWQKDFNGERRKYKNRVYFVGVYEYDEDNNTVNITDLPPGLHSQIYLKGDEKKNNREKKKITNSEKRVNKKSTESKKGSKGPSGIIYKEFIDNYDDRTTSNKIDILLYLKDGAFEEIKKYGNDTFDCFEEYLELKVPMYDRINLLNEHNSVVEYKNYEDVFNNWFEYRKNLYKIRIERELILTDLRIKMLMNQQRFSMSHDTYKITKDNTLQDVVKKLSKEKYDIFNKTLLNQPKYTSISDLIRLITVEDADYDYLLDMNYKDITEEAYKKREEQIKKLKEYLLWLNEDNNEKDEKTDKNEKIIGAKIWLSEIEELESAIKKGYESDWLYGENNFKFRKNK